MMFRREIIGLLNSQYHFYNLKFVSKEELENFVNRHFRSLIGKLYHYNGNLILALEQKDKSAHDEIYSLVSQECELIKYELA